MYGPPLGRLNLKVSHRCLSFLTNRNYLLCFVSNSSQKLLRNYRKIFPSLLLSSQNLFGLNAILRSMSPIDYNFELNLGPLLYNLREYLFLVNRMSYLM